MARRDSAPTSPAAQTPSDEPSSDAIDGVGALAEAALRLLDAVPQHPQRLRVTAGAITVDLDWRATPMPVPPVVHTPTALAAPVHAENAPAGQVTAAEPESPVLRQICAPTVGTFYHAPSPGAAPFVTEGDLVTAGQQVGIVEAMKLMVPVEADQAGRVVGVLVADAKPVEYGEPLISLGPVHPGTA